MSRDVAVEGSLELGRRRVELAGARRSDETAQARNRSMKPAGTLKQDAGFPFVGYVALERDEPTVDGAVLVMTAASFSDERAGTIAVPPAASTASTRWRPTLPVPPATRIRLSVRVGIGCPPSSMDVSHHATDGAFVAS
jgi:hypothetical protein